MNDRFGLINGSDNAMDFETNPDKTTNELTTRPERNIESDAITSDGESLINIATIYCKF